MLMNELEMFLAAWDREAESTLKLLRALPATQYDFRPDAGGRSLGELAWHLAEGDAYMSHGIDAGRFAMDAKPPNIERPRTVEALAPGYERIHREAVARIHKLKSEDLVSSGSVLHGPAAADSGHLVEHDHLSRHPSPGPTHAHVSAGGGTSAGALRAQS